MAIPFSEVCVASEKDKPRHEYICNLFQYTMTEVDIQAFIVNQLINYYLEYM